MHRHTVFCFAFLVACAFLGVACTDFDVAPVSATSMRRHFPDHAPFVLERGHGFGREAAGFVSVERGTNLRRNIDVVLPEHGDDAIHFRGMHGVEIDVREVGAFGQATREASSIAYARVGGSSFWTATAEGFEEWIHLREDVTRGRTAQLVWEVSGAPIAQDGPSVVVLDPQGIPALRVTAPIAFDRIGRNVPVEMRACDSRIELFVESNGEEVLVDPNWVMGTAMGTARYLHTATALSNGDVLIVGGLGGMGSTPFVERWSAVSGTWTMTNSLPNGTARAAHTAIKLPDERVFVVGGMDGLGASLASTAYFDVGANSWMPGPTLATARAGHTMTPLADGRLLVVGGWLNALELDSAEVLDGGAWVPTAPMSTPRYGHTASLLQDGRVLVAGGGSGFAMPTYELYDPATNTWSATKNLLAPHFEHTAVRLDNDKVLVAGGHTPAPGTLFSSAELYDPAADAWTTLGNLETGRYWHTATWLPKGAVFVVGGYPNTNTTEFIKPNIAPDQDTWFAGPPLAIGRHKHTTTLLNDGRLLVAGGKDGSSSLSSVEILQTQVEIGLACSNGIECTSGSCADGVCCDRQCDSACTACSIAAGAAQDGVCMVLGGACASAVTCHIGICDPSTGDCLSVPAPDNTPCEGTFNGMPTSGVCLAASCYVEEPEMGTGGAGGGSSTGGAGGATSSSGAVGMGGAGADGGAGGDSTGTNGSGGSDPDACGCRVIGIRHTPGAPPYGIWAALSPLLWVNIRRARSSRTVVKDVSKS